ncbi:tRNA-splicing endonuclease subunit Sen34 [Hoplias malabaricus]|uniref:tRNA-splicing endonuclease subunit Sen34 n=1 Tax=Hoplias malabaricus TaxID=27720 RepID=UPI0034627738
MDWEQGPEESETLHNGDRAEAREKENGIALSFSGSSPLLWRVADIKVVREQEGIVGSLVGSLARQPRQNVRLGRPLELLGEEASLLLDNRRATAVRYNDNQENEEHHLKAVQEYQARQEHSYEEQCVLALEDKKAVLQRVMSDQQNDPSGNEGTEQALRERLSSLEKNFSLPRSAMAIQLCTARAGFSHCPEELDFLAADWPMPRNKRLETRIRVYRDLRRRGFYLTAAGKFGGDYLVYPGDPLRFHAHFIALCLSMDEQLPLFDVLAVARLGSNVKKTVLLCSPKDPSEAGVEGEVVYSSLQWSGMV